MFCPVCKCEYRAGFTHCPDCDVDLVDSLPEEKDDGISEEERERLDNINFVPVLTTRDATDIINLKSILDAEEITYFIQGENMKFIRPVDSATLMVKEDEVKRVLKLLKKIKLNYFRFIFSGKGYE